MVFRRGRVIEHRDHWVKILKDHQRRGGSIEHCEDFVHRWVKILKRLS